ncbi:MAG: DUF1801 domain-containing protein [Saprospiraceae bacterium]
MSKLSSEVSNFLDKKNHPLRTEIDLLRYLILIASPDLVETVKWNGPNYSVQGLDRITMKIFPPKKIQLVFHTGAAKTAQPEHRILSTKSNLLVWKENNRAIASFSNQNEIKSLHTDILQIVADWVAATRDL